MWDGFDEGQMLICRARSLLIYHLQTQFRCSAASLDLALESMDTTKILDKRYQLNSSGPQDPCTCNATIS